VNNLTITPKQITPISSINNILQSTPIIIDFVDQVTSNVYNQQNDNDYNKKISQPPQQIHLHLMSHLSKMKDQKIQMVKNELINIEFL
jgi:hypothetical protein